MSLILTSFQKALSTLHQGLERAVREPDDLEVRDACIQRFEYTYELSIKFIKRYIETQSSITENVDQLNLRDLLRVAGEVGLIHSVELWFSFREARNNTSHTYDELKAIEVFKRIPAFVLAADYLLNKIESGSKSS